MSMAKILSCNTVILFAALLFVLPASAQTYGDIEGTVVEMKNGHGIPGASVAIEGINRGTGTDGEGHFTINRLVPGTYKVVVSSLGFLTRVEEIEIGPLETVDLKFVMDESPLEVEGIVVTGTRTPRYIKEVPIRTEVITRKAIENKSAANLYEALAGTPGVRVEQQCQACNFSVLRLQGLGADHTQILLDGQPVYSGLASVYGLQQLGTADIQQIEVVKGAGSALYGSNAIAGAINIISVIPQKPEGLVGVEIGQHGTNKYKITAATREGRYGLFLFAQQNRGNAIDVSGAGLDANEVRRGDGVADRVQTDAKNAGCNLFVDDVIKNDKLTVRGRIVSETRRGGTIDDDIFENPFTAGTERIITDRYSGEVGYLKNFPSGAELNLNISYSHHQRNATNDTFLGDYLDVHGEEPPVALLRPYLADEDLIVTAANYTHQLSGRHRLLVGGQFTHNELEESGKYVVVDESDPDYGTPYTSLSDKVADELGVYVQDEFSITEKLEVVAGLRFDYHASEDNFRGSGSVIPNGLESAKYDERRFNPRFAVRYNASSRITLRGSLGTGFRVPYGFSEDLHLCSGSPRVYKGDELHPERSLSYNATIDYNTSRVLLSFSAYRTELKDAIAFTDAGEVADLLGYTYEWKNIDDAYVMGAEATAQIALHRDLALGVNIAFNRGKYDHPRVDWIDTPFMESSRNISRYPETEGGFKIEYSPRDWSFVVNGEYKGLMYIDYFADGEVPTNIKETEPFFIMNARVSRELFERFKLYLGGRNLTDYIQKERHTDDAAFMYAPVYGRIIYGGMEVSL
jgi:outer membrane receptor for ferrienterochelin and colicins